MSTTAAQRRGGKTKPAEAITFVESGGAGEAVDGNEGTMMIKRTKSNEIGVPTATVRRNACGTGPFDKHWLNLDCCGLVCALFTYFLHLYAIYAVCVILLPPWMSTTDAETSIRTMSMAGTLHRMVFTLIAALAVVSHFKAMTTDPGAVPPDAKPILADEDNAVLDEESKGLLTTTTPSKHVRRLCRRCKSFKPQRAHHCSVCRRCIVKMDHHCPWVNNCVGIGNHKYFLLFVFYTFLSCVYSLILVVTRFSTCMSDPAYRHGRHYHQHQLHHEPGERHHHSHYTCLDKSTHLLNILGLLIEALLFGMFTSCMMFDQGDVIRSKVTHIDRLKGESVGGTLAGVTEVFGVGRRGVETKFRLDWLSPFRRVCFPPSVHDEVMGFCRPCKPKRETELTDLV